MYFHSSDQWCLAAFLSFGDIFSVTHASLSPSSFLFLNFSSFHTFILSKLCFVLNLLRFIIDSLSVERNHVLVRVSLVGGPSERKLPPRALQEVRLIYLFHRSYASFTRVFSVIQVFLNRCGWSKTNGILNITKYINKYNK